MNEQVVSRRGLVRAGAVGVAALTVSQVSSVAAQTPAPPGAGEGVGGGGVVPNGAGEAHFALAVVSMPAGDEAPPLVTGSFTLTDASQDPPVDIVSEFFNEMTVYSTELPNARQIIGWARASGNGPFPFLLQVEDIGPAGSGEDTFNLVFGEAAVPFLPGGGGACDCGGFTYSLRGNVVAGDLSLFALAAAG